MNSLSYQLLGYSVHDYYNTSLDAIALDPAGASQIFGQPQSRTGIEGYAGLLWHDFHAIDAICSACLDQSLLFLINPSSLPPFRLIRYSGD